MLKKYVYNAFTIISYCYELFEFLFLIKRKNYYMKANIYRNNTYMHFMAMLSSV